MLILLYFEVKLGCFVKMSKCLYLRLALNVDQSVACSEVANEGLHAELKVLQYPWD